MNKPKLVSLVLLGRAECFIQALSDFHLRSPDYRRFPQVARTEWQLMVLFTCYDQADFPKLIKRALLLFP